MDNTYYLSQEGDALGTETQQLRRVVNGPLMED